MVSCECKGGMSMDNHVPWCGFLQAQFLFECELLHVTYANQFVENLKGLWPEEIIQPINRFYFKIHE